MRHRPPVRSSERSPFEIARRILCGSSKHEPRPVEQRLADVSLLDELASLDAATAKGAFERMERSRADGDPVDPVDVQLFASSAESVRRSVEGKARILGTYGAVGGRSDKNEIPTFRIEVSAGKLPPETGAIDADEDPG